MAQKNKKKFFDWVENNVGKKENTGAKHFLLFRQCFQKPFFSNIVKTK